MIEKSEVLSMLFGSMGTPSLQTGRASFVIQRRVDSVFGSAILQPILPV